jgi:hypothetical protein
MVPIDPPPPVKFEEFDGMNRIIFSRPNKTVRGNFQAKGVMKMLEQNRRTWIATQKTVRYSFPPFGRFHARNPKSESLGRTRANRRYKCLFRLTSEFLLILSTSAYR